MEPWAYNQGFGRFSTARPFLDGQLALASADGSLGWLDRLRFRFAFAVEVLDTDLTCILPPPQGRAADIRETLVTETERLRTCAAAVLRSAKAHAFSAGEFRLRVFPLFDRESGQREAVGVLLLGDRQPLPRDAQALDELDRRLDATGQWLAAAVESTFGAATGRAGVVQTTKLLAVVDILPTFEEIDDVSELIGMAVEAMAVWFDADVRAYRLDTSGSFVLDAWLPGVDVAGIPKRLSSSPIWDRNEVFKVDSSRTLEDIGWDVRRPDVLFVPIAVEDSVEWLITVIQATEGVEPVLALLRRILGMRATAIRRDAADRVRRRVKALLEMPDAPFEITARLALETIATAGGATGAALDVAIEGRQESLLAISVGTATPPAIGPTDDQRISRPIVRVALPLVPGTVATFTFLREIGTFALDRVQLLHAGIELMTAWLAGAFARQQRPRLSPSGVPRTLMERLEAELGRASRRPDTGALVVVVPQTLAPTGGELDEAADLIQDQVRSSDVVEVMSSSFAAALVFDADANTASSVVQRVARQTRRSRTRFDIASVQIGVGAEPAGAVMRRALEAIRRDSAPSAE